MRDLHQVVRRIEEQRVQPELRTDARRNDGRLELPTAARFHFTGDLEGGSARRVLLLRVMPFLESCRVLRESREELAGPPRQLEDDVRTGREIRCVDTTDSCSLDAFPHVVDPIVPSGRADDERDAVLAGDRHRPVDGSRLRKIDQHLGTVDGLCPRCLEDADHLVPALLRHPLDRLSHLAVAVQRDLHFSAPKAQRHSPQRHRAHRGRFVNLVCSLCLCGETFPHATSTGTSKSA